MLAPLTPIRDIRLSGHVIYVGKSSMEVAVKMEAVEGEEDEEGETVMLGESLFGCFFSLFGLMIMMILSGFRQVLDGMQRRTHA